MRAEHESSSVERFTIRWVDGMYRVSIPEYDGGEVVTAEAYDRLRQIAAETAAAIMLGVAPETAVHKLARVARGEVLQPLYAPAPQMGREDWNDIANGRDA